MSAADAGQPEKILRDYKYPDPDGLAQARYYEPARTVIEHYLKTGNDGSVIDAALDDMRSDLLRATSGAAVRIEHNIRAVQAYRAHHGSTRMVPLPVEGIHMLVEGVGLSLRPDLVVSEGKRIRVVRLVFSERGTMPGDLRYGLPLLRTYAVAMKLSVTNADCRILDVGSSQVSSLQGAASSFRARLTRTCREIKRNWEGL